MAFRSARFRSAHIVFSRLLVVFEQSKKESATEIFENNKKTKKYFFIFCPNDLLSLIAASLDLDKLYSNKSNTQNILKIIHKIADQNSE